MKLQVSVLDRALEWLIPKIGITDDVVMNEESGEDIDSLQALCIWCLRLRYNLVEHQKDGYDSDYYDAWYGYRYEPSCNIYKVISKIARQFTIEGGVVPDYGQRTAKSISSWTYKRILGPDKFVPIHVNIEELWQAVRRMFPDMISDNEEQESKDVELEFKMWNKTLASVVTTM